MLQITAAYKPAYIYGGPTMSVSRLSEALVSAGVEVEVFTTTANGKTELPVLKNAKQNVDGVNVIYFHRITKDHSHLSPRLLFHLWKKVRTFDVVHIHAWWNLVSVLSCLIALLRNVPVILSPRGTLSPYSFSYSKSALKKWFHIVIGKGLLNRCYIHTTSEREQLAMASILQPKGIFTIHNFVGFPDLPLVQQERDSSTLKLLFFSRIDRKKGLELLFHALSTAAFIFKLTIAGSGEDGYIKELKQLCKNYQIEDRVHWAGFIKAEKFTLLAAHDLLVLPSYDENFANVVIESLSVGTAVLLSENVGLSKYVENNKLGWICENNPSSIHKVLNELSKTPDALKDIRRAAPGVIVRDFDENRQIEKYMDMYKRMSKHE